LWPVASWSWIEPSRRHRLKPDGEVHSPDIVGAVRRPPVVPELRPDPTLRHLVPELQAQLPVKLVGSLMVHSPTLTLEQHMDAPIAVAHPSPGDLLHPGLDGGLVGSAGAVVIG
jgi:hypothetical protein